jgi:hypothetical protein
MKPWYYKEKNRYYLSHTHKDNPCEDQLLPKVVTKGDSLKSMDWARPCPLARHYTAPFHGGA